MSTNSAKLTHLPRFSYTYEHFVLDIDALIKYLGPIVSALSNVQLYPVPRGGLIPGTVLSHKLDIPLITKLDPNPVLQPHNPKLLIVDDLLDIGTTVYSMRNRALTAGYKLMPSVALLARQRSYVFPNWTPRHVSYEDYSWIDFWWENK